jgi:hypothetical protein
VRHGSKLTEIVVERISVKIEKLSIKMLENRYNNKECKFPSMFKQLKNESDYNMFPKDYDGYNATKTLI